MRFPRRKFLKVAGLFVPAAPAILRAQSFSFQDQAFMGQGGSNHLLNGLVSYWPIDGATSITADSEDGNTLTLSGGTGNGSGGPIAGTGYLGSSGNASLSISPAPTNLKLGTGKSFTVQIWINPLAAGSQTNLAAFASQFDNTAGGVAWQVEFATSGGNLMYFVVYCTDTTQQFVTVPWPSNVWHHVLVGYDSTSKTGFLQVDAGTRQTLTTSADLQSVTTAFRFGQSAAAGAAFYAGGMAQAAFWNRALTTADAANLYNSGNGLPFSSFQA